LIFNLLLIMSMKTLASSTVLKIHLLFSVLLLYNFHEGHSESKFINAKSQESVISWNSPKLDSFSKADGLYAVVYTSRGEITCRLNFEKVPRMCGNFMALCRGFNPQTGKRLPKPFYDGLKWDDVKPRLVIMGGDCLDSLVNGLGYFFNDEFDNTLSHDGPGVLSMANLRQNLNTTQFCIWLRATPWPDNKHSVFGTVVSGQDVANSIIKDDRIDSIRILASGLAATQFDPVKAFHGTYVPQNQSSSNTELNTLKEEQIANKIFSRMVKINGGRFNMGSDSLWSLQPPVHNVKLDTFYIGKYEVTQDEYASVMGSNPSFFGNCPDCPVENVSWNDAQKFIARLNSISDKKYRLPTEAEWEYAARGGSHNKDFRFSGSNNIDEVAWSNQNSNYSTHAVGLKQPNELGLHDLTGNVGEFCSDIWAEDYYRHSPVENPKGPNNGTYRVLRGGSWMIMEWSSLSFTRSHISPYKTYNDVGFRLATDW
jgi:formylglycine-generating enzyme required for sulfatase activity